MSKLDKRKAKAIGALNYTYSLLSGRYSNQNFNRLINQTSLFGINKVHVGCGLCYLPGWLNVEFDKRKLYGALNKLSENTYLLNIDIIKGFPCRRNSIDFIAAAHFIEHLDLNQGLEFCKNAYKVMVSGGIIRISCPNLEIYARNYIENNKHFFNDQEIKKACAFKQAETPSQIFAAKAYDSGGAHKWFHDFSSLENILRRAGFLKIRKVGRLEGLMPELERLEIPQREIETVYVEATK